MSEVLAVIKMRGQQTWNGKPSPYWQHNSPLACPKKHTMGWLGSVYWFCSQCRTIWVQVADSKE